MTDDEINWREEKSLQRDESLIGPGQLLARKREALGMTVRQVAEELHITMHYVRALEENAHEKLPGDVFIRGYIRSYANLLKLDPVVLINVYNEFSNQNASVVEDSFHVPSRRRRKKNIPWIAISGVAFVGIAVALWYFGTRLAATPSESDQGAVSPAPAVVPAPALSDGSTPSLDNVATTRAADVLGTDSSAQQTIVPAVTPGATSTAAQSSSSAGVASDAAQDSASADATISTANAQQDSAAQALTLETSESGVGGAAPAGASGVPVTPPNTVSDPSLPVAPGTVPDVGQPAASLEPRAGQSATPVRPSDLAGNAARVISVDTGGEDLVQITFNGESMVQVEDSNDQQVYRGIRTTGDVLRITGSAPFNVLLGDAASTELSLNGNNIDFTSNIRVDNSVRLTIGL